MRELEASIVTSSAVLKRARAIVLRQHRPLLHSFRSWAHALLRSRALERWRREISERLRWHRGRRAAMAWHQTAAMRRYVISRLSAARSALLHVQSFASWNALTYGTRGGWGKAGGRSAQRRKKELMISALESKTSRRVLRGWFGAWGAWVLRCRRVTLAQGKTAQRRWRHAARNVLRHWQQGVDVRQRLAHTVDKVQRLLARRTFSKELCTVALDGTCPRALTSENFCADERGF